MCVRVVRHLKLKNAVILKTGGERWKGPWTGSAPELKEKKRVVRAVSQGHTDADAGVGAEKDVVRKKDPNLALLISSHS